MELPNGMSCWSSGKWSEMMMLSGLARRRDKSRRCHYLTAGEAARVGVAACAWAGAVGGVPGGAAARAAGVVAVLARGGRVPVARVGVGSAHGVDDPADSAALLHNHRRDLVVVLGCQQTASEISAEATDQRDGGHSRFFMMTVCL